MESLLFESWNRETDVGVGELDSSLPRPCSYAEVFLDWRALPYRVVVRNPRDMKSLDKVDDEVFVYDYYYNDERKIVEKRSLDGEGRVVVIVRSEYDSEKKIAEVGWYPQSGKPPIRVKTA